MKNNIITITLFILCFFILLLSLRGIAGNPTLGTINDAKWTTDGPLELSPDRGRFALTYSIVEENSFFFSLPIARFATPDLGYKNGHYVSLFAPFVSYVIIPGYILGKLFGLAQVGSFAVIAFIALLNVVLIRLISMRLGANKIAATLAGLVFLFATPAYAYAVSLYQHHISTFLILLTLYILLRWKNLKSLFFVWLLFGISLPIDNPNLFLMAPLVIYASGRFFSINKMKEKINFSFHFLGVLTFLGGVLPLLFFLWFNQMSYGNPLQLGGTVASVKAIDANGKPTLPQVAITDKKTIDGLLDPAKQNKSVIQFFQSRNLINGLYELFISQDRGMLYFTPVMFIGMFGGILLYRKKSSILVVLVGIIGMNVLLYAMWGDPYGGWAFGSRYLIPAYAIIAILLSFVLSAFRKNIWFLLFFSLVVTYSISVNTVGAITSNSNPPKSEVLALEKLYHTPETYSFDRNIQLLSHNTSKSFIWQTYFKSAISAVTYYWILVTSILLIFVGQIISLRIHTTYKPEDRYE